LIDCNTAELIHIDLGEFNLTFFGILWYGINFTTRTKTKSDLNFEMSPPDTNDGPLRHSGYCTSVLSMQAYIPAICNLSQFPY
jgi:hypothetical protein